MTARARAVAWAELRHTLRRPLWWVFLAIVALLSFGMSTGTVRISSGDTSVGGKVAWVTSEIMVAYLLSVTLLLYLFFVAISAGTAMIRDDEDGTSALLAATPLRPGEYLAGKATGILGAYGLAAAIHLVVLVASNHLLHDPSAHEWIGPFVAGHYLVPAISLLFPGIIAFAVLGLAIGSRYRRPVLVYLAPVFLMLVSAFFLWSFSPRWLPSALDRLMMVLDPFAFRWLQKGLIDADRGADYYNHATLPVDAEFFANRLLLGATIAVGLWAARRSTARHWIHGSPQRGPTKRDIEVAASSSGTLADLGQKATPPSLLRGLWVVAGFELRTVARRPGLYLFIPLIVAQVASKTWGLEGPFGTGLVPTAGSIAVASVPLFTALLCLVLMFYLVESLHRERVQRLDGIYFSTAARTTSLLLGKVLAYLAVAVGTLATCMVAATASLWAHAEAAVAIGPLLLVWGALLVPTFLLWSAWMGAVYAVTESRFATYGVGLATMAATIYAAVTGELTWVNNWALWGTLRWSDISVFELDRTALLMNRLATLVFAALLLQLAVLAFRRRAPDPLRRGGPAPRRRAPRLIPLALLAGLSLVVLEREVSAGPDGPAAERRAKSYRKAHHDTWLAAPVPSLSAVELRLDIEPQAHAFAVEGSYTVLNHHSFPLARFAVTLGAHFEDPAFTLDGEPYEPEVRADLLIVSRERPLQPGDTVRLGFRYRGRHPAGSGKHGMSRKQFILPSGVVFTSFEPAVLPVLGYLSSIGVDSDNATEPKQYFPGYHEGRLDPFLGSATPFSTHITITGPTDFTFNSVGEKVSDQSDGDRRTVVWQSAHPVRFFNVVGGRFSVTRGDGVAVFHHPGHGQNAPIMVQALEAAIEHFGRWFGAYPYGELKLTEFPGLASYAQGFPSNITFSEDIGFLADGALNAAFTVTAHEAAHQWWGNMLTPGEGPGASVIAEALSHYATLLLLEEVQGSALRREFSEVLERRYLEERRRDGERPLIEVDGSREGDTTLVYEKGAMAFWLLGEALGRDQLIAGLRAFVDRFGSGPDYPAVLDLLSLLREHSGNAEAFDALASQLFERVVLPEYRLHEATKARDGNGWRITAELENAGSGEFRVAVAAQSSGAIVAEREVVIGAGERIPITFHSALEPEELVVDPGVHVLQLGRSAARRRL